jgi:hypothetical protein
MLYLIKDHPYKTNKVPKTGIVYFGLIKSIIQNCIFIVLFFLNRIALNVPAVYDVLAARIRACVARPGPTKCAGATAWEWSVAE